MRILLTGGNGFIGAAVAKALIKSSHDLIAPIRSSQKEEAKQMYENDFHKLGEINAKTQWSHFLYGVDTIIHCAGMSYEPGRFGGAMSPALRAVNIDGTLNLASQAVTAGVKRLIFISSIKVNGEITKPVIPFTPEDPPKPLEPYGFSKFEAEQGLLKLGLKSTLEVVIIRPPLVYGFQAKNNFAKLVTLVKKGVPLPFSMVKNKRSLIAIDNLVDLIVTCINNPKAANQILLVSDGQDLSTPELVGEIANAMGVNPKLFPIPPFLINFCANIIGKGNLANSLLDSLQLDISKTKNLLGWTPPISINEGLRRCFLHSANK